MNLTEMKKACEKEIDFNVIKTLENKLKTTNQLRATGKEKNKIVQVKCNILDSYNSVTVQLSTTRKQRTKLKLLFTLFRSIWKFVLTSFNIILFK